jgi:hypothetical protein
LVRLRDRDRVRVGGNWKIVITSYQVLGSSNRGRLRVRVRDRG